MKYPLSTYRIQLSPEFKVEELGKILDYLKTLGISTIYSAPIFQARSGSTHGYDIVDPFNLNREIGSRESFLRIRREMKQKNLDWLQDIVPNHMAFDGTNPWLHNLFELGPRSRYYRFFDINWSDKQVMAPFLGKPLADVLADGELHLEWDSLGLRLRYFNHVYPVSVASYAHVLARVSSGQWEELFKSFSGTPEEWQELKSSFLAELDSDTALKIEIEKTVEQVNQNTGKLLEILSLQFFKPVYWKETESKINYRRFFTINDLICLRMEDNNVFQIYHSFIKHLIDSGFIDGLRIDHIDGLLDPLQYLSELRQLVGQDFYVVVEKILESSEQLPSNWPVEGSSGYDFLALVNQLMTDSRAREYFTKIYQNIYPLDKDFQRLVYEQKLFILNRRMGGELQNLFRLAVELDLVPREQGNWKKALGHFLAAFPVYRIYPSKFPLSQGQQKIIDTASSAAQEYAPEIEVELRELRKIFSGKAQAGADEMLSFLRRCQQFTGPLAAKGVEDTLFYRYNRLIAHNEVGDSPDNFGRSAEDFHKEMRFANRHFPNGINATATHDTKRGEDSRMRIAVLSELPEQWFENVQEWRKLAASLRKKNVPSPNEEYFIFQMLIGAFPTSLETTGDFEKRCLQYLVKVLREAKENSSWSDPDEAYEQQVSQYLHNLLRKEEILSSFLPFQKKIMAYGALKSLGQVLLKNMAPGVPDLYQGTELWDLSYVDPDNRRKVDFGLRKRYLSEIVSTAPNRKQELLELKKNYTSGKIKLYCLHLSLKMRSENPDLFANGDYIPVDIEGAFRQDLLAFARHQGNHWCLVVVPVLVTRLFNENLELLKDFGKKPMLKLPPSFPTTWENIFTKETTQSQNYFLGEDLFGMFPVACFINR